MTYELVGRSAAQGANELSVTDWVLEGKAYRRSLIRSEDESVSAISGNLSFLAEIKERMGCVYEGAVSPIALARRLISIVAANEAGRLFIWDMDSGSDYALFVNRGYLSFVSSSAYADHLNQLLVADDLKPIDWHGPIFPCDDIRARLATHLSTSKELAQSAMAAASIECAVKMFASQNVRISWVEGCPQHEPYFHLPISEFVSVGIETTASEQDLQTAIEQVGEHLYPTGSTEWKPWFPVAAFELFETPSEHYRIEELVRLFKSHGSGQISESGVNASLLTFLSSGYLTQRASSQEKGAQDGTQPSSAPQKNKVDRLNKDYYRRLNVANTASILEIRGAFQSQISELNARHERGELDTEMFEQLKHQHEEAEIILTDRMTRRAYDEAVAARIDFVEHGLAGRILADHFRKEGERRLRDRNYEHAVEVFRRSYDYEPSEQVKLLSFWAEFLSGEQSRERGAAIIEEMRTLAGDGLRTDQMYLYFGKVARLSGDVDSARDYLNKAVEFDKNNQEAWGELRLLNTKQTGRKRTGLTLTLSDDPTDVRGIFAYAIFCLLLLYGLANYAPDARTEWPLLNTQELGAQAKFDNEYQSILAKQLLERIEKERAETKVIPPNKRVWGNVEYYHLADDNWFIGRRALLLTFGLVGIGLFLRRQSELLMPRSGSYGYMAIVLPYGLIVGFLSYVPATSTELSTLIWMGVLTAVAEQVFFFGFLARAFHVRLDSRLASIGLTLILFALYQYTFFANLVDSFSQSALSVLQTTLFVGAACAWVLHRSKTVLNPLILHIAVQMVLMLKFGGIL